MEKRASIGSGESGLLILAVSILAAILMGCTQQPRIITGNVSSNTSVNASAFMDAGCVDTGNGVLNCSTAAQLSSFSCDAIRVPEDLGGLTPNVPIVECEFMATNWTGGADEGIVRTGCLMPLFRRYITVSDGGFKEISSKDEFVDSFAPVETPEEALGFAIALTRSFAMRSISIPSGYNVFVNEIRTTYVEETDAGFKVHLFYSETCGCGNHPLYAVDYLVTRAGEVSETSSERIYENPAWRGLCVD